MNFVFLLFLGICVLLLILAVIGLSKPSMVEMRESIKINSTPEALFPFLADFEKFVVWSPWTANDPHMKMTFSGQKGEIEHRYEWKGNAQVGEGWMQIVHIHPNERIEIDLKFGKRNTSKTGFTIKQLGGETLVTWFLSTEIGQNPLSRLMGPIMKKYILRDFNKGLNNLKTLLES
ncbi:MAG: SRPBCC family protein [Crocinitomicaceae bacterium]|nr:SRPBCC family protein [Crocinitomicaceae bacterium]